MRPRLRLSEAARRTLAASILALAIVSAGCSDTSQGKDAITVQVATEAEVTQQVNDLAKQVVGVIGDTKLSNPASNAAPCENNVGDNSGEVQYVLGTYQIFLANNQHRGAFTQVRDHWQNQNWSITEDRFNEKLREGSVSAKESGTGFGFTLTSSASPEMLTLIVQSGCYRASTK